MQPQPIRVLFLSPRNSCRSQMAEGFAQAMGFGRVVACSAGPNPAPIHPLVIRAMSDLGIGLDQQEAKELARYEGQRFDFVISVFGSAESAPQWRGAGTQVHWEVPDPGLSRGSRDARLKAFRRARSEILGHVSTFLDTHVGSATGMVRRSALLS